MIRWAEFARAAPQMARIGKQLLYHSGRGEVAILATVDHHGLPRVAPVSPIFYERGIYLSVGAHTPKARHLGRNGHYAMHALVGEDDLEFQISGSARPVVASDEQKGVVAAIPFPSFNASDPIFELLIDHAVVVEWPERTTRGKKTVWRSRDGR